MLSYAEACAAIAEIVPLGLTERVALGTAPRRWLAEPVRLERDQPGFDRSTMDGYALVLDGERDRFRVVGTVHAGGLFAGALSPGEAVRIMTGAPVPAGTTVVPIELTDGGELEVVVTDRKGLLAGRNIAWRGEDGRAGEVVVPAGVRLSPATLAVAAMAGVGQVLCHRPPRLAVVTTGDEVGAGGEAGIADSNGPLLEQIAETLGVPCSRRHARDEPAVLVGTLSLAAASADIVVTTGGVSAGDRDLVPDIAGRLGFTTVFHHVGIQPGKPVFLARRPGPRGTATLLIGLPGNPVSVLATAHLFLLPLLGRFLGDWTPSWRSLPLAAPWEHRGRRHLFLPARMGDGGLVPVAWNGSGDLIAAGAADGLVDLPVGFTGAVGDWVRFLPYVGSAVGETGVIPPRSGR